MKVSEEELQSLRDVRDKIADTSLEIAEAIQAISDKHELMGTSKIFVAAMMRTTCHLCSINMKFTMAFLGFRTYLDEAYSYPDEEKDGANS